ncbi:tubulin monoglutamylase TTLL4 [Bombina bombina]|uniref:tubulin monoglutamylase TTLL4 n=1 Tax=Bombina bombina TaxID=8345 RepID=UPI00235AEC24|nr:tubulin monoglutamylase TTLL4 [Bombina bombina]
MATPKVEALRHNQCETNNLTCANTEKRKKSTSGCQTSQITTLWRFHRQYVNVTHRPFNPLFEKQYTVELNLNNIPSPPSTAPPDFLKHPRYLHYTFERTLVLQRPVNGSKTCQNLDPLYPGTKIVGPRPYFTSKHRLRRSPTSANIKSAMTSSLVDQFHLQSAAREPMESSLRSSCSKHKKLPSNNSLPVLVTNSLFRPNSVKVPLHPNLEIKTKSTSHGGRNPASCLDGERENWDQNGEVCHNSISTDTISYNAPLANICQGLVNFKKEGTMWQVDSSKTDELQQKLHPTEEVRLSENKDLFDNFAILHPEATSNLVCHNHIVYPSCKNKTPSALHPNSEKEVGSCNMESSAYCLNGNLSLTNTSSANVYTKQPMITNLLTVESDIDPSTSSQVANVCILSSVSQQHLVRRNKAQGENITVMASQISTIHLDKTCVQEPHVKSVNLEQEQNFSVTNLEPDDGEEELPDGLYDSQEEENEEDDEEGTVDSSSLTGSASLYAVSSSVEGRMELLPLPQRKLLKWRMSTVTPNVVKQTIARSHFRVTKKNHDWLGCWGHHMKSPAFKTIRYFQKLNHFPGSFQIGRKDRLWRNLSKMQARFGKKEFNFFPQSFVLPQDIKLLRKAWEEGGTRQKWIVKPPASARGMGIQVIHKWSQLPKKRPLLVQRYLHKPYLISGSKFDLRIYVYVTSYDPLRVYLFRDGLVRFASCKYSSSMKSLSNKFMHLTNYSVNKKNVDYKANSDQTACQGHKWALKALWSYLDQEGINSDKIWEKIKDMVIKTIIASEPYVNSLVKMYVQSPYSCHELFGFDIMLDENLKPWVLEVNISPSLHSNSQLDIDIKGQMIRDLLNLAGFVLPNRNEISSRNTGTHTSASSRGKEHVHPEMVNGERMKRAYYLSQKLPDKDLYATILDQLTPEDVKVLVETEDELSRCGHFERIFPTSISSRYLRFFEQPRYFNILTNQWEQKYYANRERGRDFLKSLCLMNFHVGAVSQSPVWSLPKSHSDLYLNGFSRSEVMKCCKSPIKSEAKEEGLECQKTSPFRHSSVDLQQPELTERPHSKVSESALVI